MEGFMLGVSENCNYLMVCITISTNTYTTQFNLGYPATSKRAPNQIGDLARYTSYAQQ